MATDRALDTANCFLIPGRFGPPQPHIFGGLLGGVLGSDHNVATASFDVGTVMSFVNKGTVAGSREGMTEFVYGKYVSADPKAMAVGQTAISVCDGGTNSLFTFTNYAEENSGSLFMGQENYAPFGVICLSVMTNGRYGWFWCGGVAPEDTVTACTGEIIVTSNAVVEGVFCTEDVSAVGIIGIGPYDDSVATSTMLAAATGVSWLVPMGFALAADAT